MQTDSCQNIWSSRHITADVKEKKQEGPLWRRNEPYSFIFPYQTNENHNAEFPTVCFVISERRWKGTFAFTEIVNNYVLKRGTVCQTVRFITHISLKLHMQYGKYFHSVVLGSVGRDYNKSNRALDFLAKIFG